MKCEINETKIKKEMMIFVSISYEFLFKLIFDTIGNTIYSLTYKIKTNGVIFYVKKVTMLSIIYFYGF